MCIAFSYRQDSSSFCSCSRFCSQIRRFHSKRGWTWRSLRLEDPRLLTKPGKKHSTKQPSPGFHRPLFHTLRTVFEHRKHLSYHRLLALPILQHLISHGHPAIPRRQRLRPRRTKRLCWFTVPDLSVITPPRNLVSRVTRRVLPKASALTAMSSINEIPYCSSQNLIHCGKGRPCKV